MKKTYSDLIKLESFRDRLEYIYIGKRVGDYTFAGNRYLNQSLYKTWEWRTARRKCIIRDAINGHCCDLAHPDYPILGYIYVHHINPITVEDILEQRDCVFDLENLVCSSMNTHNFIHYGKKGMMADEIIERRPNDTCPWR